MLWITTDRVFRLLWEAVFQPLLKPNQIAVADKVQRFENQLVKPQHVLKGIQLDASQGIGSQIEYLQIVEATHCLAADLLQIIAVQIQASQFAQSLERSSRTLVLDDPGQAIASQIQLLQILHTVTSTLSVSATKVASSQPLVKRKTPLVLVKPKAAPVATPTESKPTATSASALPVSNPPAAAPAGLSLLAAYSDSSEDSN